jgi:hypothetical protein
MSEYNQGMIDGIVCAVFLMMLFASIFFADVRFK